MKHAIAALMFTQLPVMAAAAAVCSEAADSIRERESEQFAWAASEGSAAGNPKVRASALGGDLIFGFGGSVKASMSYDLGSPLDNAYSFITSEIPSTTAPGSDAAILFSAQCSDLYLNIVALPDSKERVAAYFNINLQGEHYLPKVQYAYLRWRGLKAGYYYTLFNDPLAAIPTIDYEGPNVYNAVQMVQISWEGALSKDRRLYGGIGLARPILSIADFRGVQSVTRRVPDIPAFLKYSFSRASYIRIAAIFRNMTYRDLPADKNVSKAGFGLHLSGAVEVAPKLMLYAQGVAGQGISSYYQDLFDSRMDMVADAVEGALSPLRSWGAYAGVLYSPTDRLSLCAGYSQLRLYPRAGQRMPDVPTCYRYAQYASATAAYAITRYLNVGIEYIYGRRVNFPSAPASQAHTSRLQTAVTFAF